MSCELVQALRAALEDGCSLAELEATLLAGADREDQIAAAWLYAWAYDAIRPPRDDLAARITNGAAPDHAPKRSVIPDAAIDRPIVRGPSIAPTGGRRDFHARIKLGCKRKKLDVLQPGPHDPRAAR